MTAIVQILYDGPADRFAWFLPVPGVPDLDVSSDTFFTLLQNATNPTYTFNTALYGDCPTPANLRSPNNGSGSFNGNNDVSVLASGALGPYDYDVIEVDEGVVDKAAVAVDWLEANDYFIGPGQEELIGPYLDAGMNLIAFRLQKDRSAGDIQPIVMTYQTEQPMIPIKLTAVAANDDMGVLVWVLGESRAVPVNYRSLILNEAAIDWFNPGPTYADVVNLAADQAGGQGFVTEAAGDTRALESAFGLDDARRLIVRARGASDVEYVADVIASLGGWAGMDTALESTLLVGSDLTAAEVLECPSCVLEDGDFDAFLEAVEEWVIAPVRRSVEVFVSRPWYTRMYTTMSAEDMTLDPLFDFNPDLEAVSNTHLAELAISRCDEEWNMTLPGGQQVWGQRVGQWPFTPGDAMPANLQIEQLSTSGEGTVVEDNTARVQQALTTQKERILARRDDGCACSTAGRGTSGALPAFLLTVGLIGVASLRRRR